MFIIEYMTTPPVIISPETSIPEAGRILKDYHFRHLPVVGKDQRLIGMVTDRDIRSAYPSTILSPDEIRIFQAELEKTPVETIMSIPRFELFDFSTLDDALIILDRENIGALPVVDDSKKLIGIFSIRDLMAAYRKIFGLGERGSSMIVIEEHDGRRNPLSRIAAILEEHNIRFTRLIRTEAVDNKPDRIYLRVNTYNISAVHNALREAGITVVLPERR
ncbi:MAG: CBS domain-containing protein [Desulfurivibrionaceae bacterium]